MQHTVKVAQDAQTMLLTLQGLTYQRPHLAGLLRRRADRVGDPFTAYLLEKALPSSMLYNDIMMRHDGNPIGIEFRDTTREAWAFLLPDASAPGKFRVQYFDAHGFSRHHTVDSLHQALEDMLAEHYTIKDAGALDRLSQTAEWKRGTEVAGLMMRHNSGQIDYAEFVRLAEAL